MPRYAATVTETRSVRTTYIIEADTPTEAIEKAICGETLQEIEDPHSLEVVNRTVETVEKDGN